jgi:hypothetical protein
MKKLALIAAGLLVPWMALAQSCRSAAPQKERSRDDPKIPAQAFGSSGSAPSRTFSSSSVRLVHLHSPLEINPPTGCAVFIKQEMLTSVKFEVKGFMAPYVIVRRKSDDAVGSLEFQHEPRYYFSFQEDGL